VADSADQTTSKKKVYNNFEIADLDFWRGKAYSAFFEYLDRRGGFYYEVNSSLSTHPAAPDKN
jgi:alpha 1,2-mannosyltransferase